MKKLTLYLFLFSLPLIFLGCGNDDDPQATIPKLTSVSLSSFPADETFMLLDPASTDSLKIYWQRTLASNGTLVLYTVQFDEEDGDFTTPVGTVVSDSVGLSRSARIPHKTLNIFAENAGIEPLAKGKLKWRVVASTGIVSVYSEPHTLEVERPLGIAEMPDNVYITGSAAEGGADALQGIAFKKITEIVDGKEQIKKGHFEIYTSLTSGTYRFASSNTTSPVVFFYIENGRIKKNGATNSPVDKRTFYHIYLDFNTAEATISEIREVGVWHAESNDVIQELTYTENGVWSASNVTPFVTGMDDRYKFRMTKKAADGTLSDVFWSSTQLTNPRPTSSTLSTYYHLIPRDFTQYDHCYKFASAAENRAIDIHFRLRPSATYTHEVDVR